MNIKRLPLRPANPNMIIPQPIPITYSDAILRILVEEYITQQRNTFTLKGVCSYVLYWAMEEGHTTKAGLYESSQLAQADDDAMSRVNARL